MSKKSSIKESSIIAFKDLPITDSYIDCIYSAMTYLDEQIDLAKCSNCLLIIPTSSICFRNIVLPDKLQRKIKQILPYEIDSLLPESDRKYLTDFSIIDVPKKEDHLPVFTASAIESNIDDYVSLLNNFGIKSDVIIPKGYAIALGLIKSYPKIKHFICLDIGISEHTLVLVYNHTPVTIHTFPTSQYNNGQLDILVKQALLGFRQNFDIETPFNFFITADREYNGFLNLYSRFESLLQEQNKLLDQVRLLPSDNEYDETSNLKQVDTSQLFSKIQLDAYSKTEINFNKVRKRNNFIFKENLNLIVTTIALSITLLILSIFSMYKDINHLNQKIEVLSNKSKTIVQQTFPNEKSIKFPLLQMKSLIKESNAVFSKRKIQQLSNFKTIDVLTRLSESIPSTIDVEISKLVLNQNNLIISGETNNFNSVDMIKKNIEDAIMFKMVSIKNASINNKNNKISFKLSIQI